MTPSQLTPEILERMKPADRARLGVQTQGEAEGKFVARSERELQNAIAGLLTIRGVWFCRSRMDRATTQARGVPDFLLAIKGRAVALEVKFANGKLSEDQERTHEKMALNGWRVETVRTLDEARAILDEASTYIG